MSVSRTRFIDIHIIQSLPYSNLNRDDTNSVKVVQYGGKERTRVSSQSWKRACRPYFQELIGEEALRTRRLGERLAAELRDVRGWPADLARRAGQHLTIGSGIKADEPKKKDDAAADERDWRINAMVYIPHTAINQFADLADKHRAELESAGNADKPQGTAKGKETPSVFDTSELQSIIKSRNGVINLFGRMLAEVDDAGVDGAVQVAHAFTTHATATEIDYFAAVDDITDAWNQVGSAHIGDAEFSAGTFYRYATIDLDTLMSNVGNDESEVRKLVSAFMNAFIMSIPQAKKTATAPHTVPSLVHLGARTDRPVSYAAAFEKPVRAKEGFDAESQRVMGTYAAKLAEFLGNDKTACLGYHSFNDEAIAGLGDRHDSLKDLIASTMDVTLGESETA